MNVRSYGMTDQGRVRQSNQDQFVVAELRRTLRVHQGSMATEGIAFSDNSTHVFVVADGMGGHQGGQVASELAVKSIQAFLLNSLRQIINLEPTKEQSLLLEFKEALTQADATLCEQASRRTDLNSSTSFAERGVVF